MKSQLWKTQKGRQRLEAWYDHFQAKIETPVQSIHVPTTWGENHVLVVGPEDAPPLVALHAMRTGASFLLAELAPLLTLYRVYAPDLPGQSIRGLDVRQPLDDQSAVRWTAELLDSLSLGSTNLFGISWGGYLARAAASALPERVNKLALMVPAGIANGSHLTGLLKMAFPMIRYQIRPTEANLKKLLTPIVSSWDEDWGAYIGCSLRDLKMDPRIPPLATDAQLQALTMPVLAIVGDDDISFPGRAIHERLRRVLPSAEIELVENCKHCPPTTPEFRAWLAGRLKTFFG